jgi:hypothetical protein
MAEKDKEKKDVPTVRASTNGPPPTPWRMINGIICKTSSVRRHQNFPRSIFRGALQRYEIGDDWQPKKIEVKIDVPEEILLENSYKASGPQVGENLVLFCRRRREEEVGRGW